MIDTGGKAATRRVAKARVRITASASLLRQIQRGRLPKGDCLAAAQVAGIMAAKNTPALVPLCHPLRLSHVAVDFAFGKRCLEITCVARATEATGVEMEALVGCAAAALTVYDMAKAQEQGIVIADLRLLEKTGGKRDYRAKGSGRR
jgi:cyclic pyranopterin phosphate synthase